MIDETKAPHPGPVETKANSGELFAAGRKARAIGKAEGDCPNRIADNRDRWLEGWRFEDGIIRSQLALASYEHATRKENDISR